ncbi:MAG: AMP-binding protein [Gammaproteobacteria bacterium]|nr:AMP-binding protein [Gammaproteobacteria bacterium]
MITSDSLVRKLTPQLNPEGYSSLVAAFDAAVAAFGDAPAYTSLGHTLSFSDIDVLSARLAHYLQHDAGLEPGERIAIQLPNLCQYPIAAWAAWRAGLVLVNTNPLYTKTELIHQFNDAGARALIVLADLMPMVAQVLPETKIEKVIVTNATDLLKPGEVDKCGVDCVAWAEVFVDGAAATVTTPDLQMSDVAVLQYTGGTTGVAKGAVLSHGNLFCAVRQGRSAFKEQDAARGERQEVFISPMPLYHIYGFALNIVSGFLHGAHSVLIPNPRDIDSLVQVMKQHEFTGFAGVNTLFTALLQHPGFDSIDFSYLDSTIAGGAALAVEIAEQWQQRTNSEIFEGYGLTESCATSTVNRPESNEIGTVGQPVAFVECKLIDEEGNQVPDDQEGELCLRGPHIMQGYWQRPEATAEVFDDEGWFRTGDVATVTPGGHVKIVDRIKDMILVSGFNVYPNEIENVVYSYPGVHECAAIGVKNDKTGEAVKLFVACTDSDTTEKDIIEHCREHLTAYKVPKQIEFRDELPKSNVGKILRRALRT